MDNPHASLDLRFGRKSLTTLAHRLKKNGCSSKCSLFVCRMAHLLHSLGDDPIDTDGLRRFAITLGEDVPTARNTPWNLRLHRIRKPSRHRCRIELGSHRLGIETSNPRVERTSRTSVPAFLSVGSVLSLGSAVAATCRSTDHRHS